MVRELTSSDQAIVWGLVVVDRQVLMDQARRPFSAIFAWNLITGDADVDADADIDIGAWEF